MLKLKNVTMFTDLMGYRMQFTGKIVTIEPAKNLKALITDLRTGLSFVYSTLTLPAHIRAENKDPRPQKPAEYYVRIQAWKKFIQMYGAQPLVDRFTPGTLVTFAASIRTNSGSAIAEYTKYDRCHFSNVQDFMPYTEPMYLPVDGSQGMIIEHSQRHIGIPGHPEYAETVEEYLFKNGFLMRKVTRADGEQQSTTFKTRAEYEPYVPDFP